MNNKSFFTTLLLAVVFLYSCAQTSQADFSKTEIEKRIKRDIYVLSADSFLGREAGTRGEIIARDYLNNQFKSIELSTVINDSNYFQEFDFEKKSDYNQPNSFIINGKKLNLHSEFYPLSLSGSGEGEGQIIDVSYGICAPDNNYNDYQKLTETEGKVFLLDVSIPPGIKENFVFLKYLDIQTRIDFAITKGAKAIILKNGDANYKFNPDTTFSTLTTPNTIPVVYLTEKGVAFIKAKKNNKVNFYISNGRTNYKGYNIVGKINNNSSRTIIIGAHYDHLGTGGGLSRYKGGPAVHNGADDNASGVAGVIEVARFLNSRNDLTANYIFIAFSAEEKGLLGANNFIDSKEYDMSKVICMINFDMLGRIDTASKKLQIMGVGTSAIWDSLLTDPADGSLSIKKSSSGVAGSDQLPFYLINKPVLFFFTGIHSDYHKPSDDYEKINFSGEVDVIRYAEDLLLKLDKINEIPFSKASDSEEKQTSRYKGPTLGVVPDHGYAGEGMGISEVMDERPAAKAGILRGDIIMKIGDYDVSDIRGYMNALSHFKKGDKVMVKLKRGEEIIVKEVEL